MIEADSQEQAKIKASKYPEDKITWLEEYGDQSSNLVLHMEQVESMDDRALICQDDD